MSVVTMIAPARAPLGFSPKHDPRAIRKLVLARVSEALPVFEAEAPAVTLPRELLNSAHARLTSSLSREAFNDYGFATYDAWQEMLEGHGLSAAARSALLAVDAMVAATDASDFVDEALEHAEAALALSQAAKAA